MTFATPPPLPRGEFGAVAPCGREAASADGPTNGAVHGILVGCLACAPFWTALLVATLRY